jgi:hypothetical protein
VVDLADGFAVSDRTRSQFLRWNWSRYMPLLAAVFLATEAAAAPKLDARELALARDYVFAACIMDRYPNTPLASEADAWGAALVERGSLQAEQYPLLARWARNAPEPRITRSGMEMRLQSCVDFVNARGFSNQLEQVLRRSARRR